MTVSYFATDMMSTYWILLNNNIDQYSSQYTKDLLHFTSKTRKHVFHMSLHSKTASSIRDEQFQISSNVISTLVTNYYQEIWMIFTPVQCQYHDQYWYYYLPIFDIDYVVAIKPCVGDTHVGKTWCYVFLECCDVLVLRNK